MIPKYYDVQQHSKLIIILDLLTVI